MSGIPADASRLGSSAQTAVAVRTLWEQYTWLREHRPEGTVVKRREMYDGERLLDILTVEAHAGEAHEVYFDVSACFSNRVPTPPCPYCGERLKTPKARQCAECFADFHDAAHVVYRKGPSRVDRVRAMAAERREREARPPGLADPRAAFSAQFRPRRVTADAFALTFPDQPSAIDDRLFQIGIDCLIADGCRGVVCHVDQPLRPIGPLTTSDGTENVGALLRGIMQFARHGLSVVLVRGEELNKALRGFPEFESHETDELAIAGLTLRLQLRDGIGG